MAKEHVDKTCRGSKIKYGGGAHHPNPYLQTHRYCKTISRWRLMSRADHLTDGAQLHISYYTCALSFPGMRLRFTVQEATRCPDTPH